MNRIQSGKTKAFLVAAAKRGLFDKNKEKHVKIKIIIWVDIIQN